MITLTELQSKQGNISKKYTITESGEISVNSAATIYNAKAVAIEIHEEELSSYFDSLCTRHDTCVTLGTPGKVGNEFDLVTQDKITAGRIARTKEFFTYPNSGATSICLLDFDSQSSDRQQFLDELNVLLKDSLIGEKGHQRNTICKWIRPSSSGSVSISGKKGEGLHVFIAVKSLNEKFLSLLHKWCWLQPYGRGWKLTEAGTVLAESLIDSAVNGPERVVYTSDALVEGPEKFYEQVERKCQYIPGGVIDCETACSILEELTVEFDSEWRKFKQSIEQSEEVRAARNLWIEKQTQKRIDAGFKPKQARHATIGLMEGILYSNEVLLRNDGTEVVVRDILCSPDEFIGMDKFCDPIKQEKHRNVGKILGTDEQPVLHSFSHGGIVYKLKWLYEDLKEWIEESDEDEVEDWYQVHLANINVRETTLDKLIKQVAEKLDATRTSVKKDVKAVKERNVEEEVVDTGMLPLESSQGDIADDFLRNLRDCVSFGETLYSWDGGTVWKSMNSGVVLKKIRQDYNHVKTCQRRNDYNAITRLIVEDVDIRVDRWKETSGIPCSDGFWAIEDGDVVRKEYSKELGCRFKLGLKPDFTMKTPMFDKVIANVDNPVLFQQLIGLVLSGYLPTVQKAMIMFGDGGAGKGTTEDIMAAMLPRNRMTSMKLEQMNDPTYLVQLADSRVNFTSEVKAKKVDLTGAKMAIGGGLITGRALYAQPVQFYSNCSFVISFNKFFPLESIGTDVQRRFGHTIVKFTKRNTSQVDGLAQIIIQNELPGILAWAIEGIKLYFQFGLEDSLSLELFDRWMLGIDPVTLFLDENIEVSSRSWVDRAETWKRFQDFCGNGAYGSITKGQFFDALTERFGVSKPSNGVVKLLGIRWKQ